MNAVKRCLALIAATLVVGACGGDPTIDDAGTDLSIRATPGAVWMRNNTTATVNIEAVDKLGGPAAGSWAVGAIVGPMTAAIDPDYQNTTAGALGLKARFVVTPTAEGEGSVTFTGTGGPITVPVRIAPDTAAFAVTFSSLTPALGEVVTATAPAGIRFTSGTAVAFYDGPLSGDINNGLSAPSIVSMSADSTQLSFVNAPSAGGQMRFTGVASISTPGLTSTARSVATVTGATQDTSNLPVTLNNNAPTVTDTVIATIAAPYRFTLASNGLSITPTSGGAAPLFVGFSADSSQVSFVVPPGAAGKVRFPRVVFINGPAVGFAGRSTDILTAAPPPPLNATFSNATPAVNTPITITMPAGFKFRPTSAISGTTGMSWVVLSRAADSSAVTVLPLAGYSGAVNITNVQLSAAPAFLLTLSTTGTVTVGAAVDLGSDDPANGGNPSFAAPTTTGGITAWYDLTSMDLPDPTCDGGAGIQFYTVTVATTGSYTVTANWTTGTDVDIGPFEKTGVYDCDFLSFGGLTGSKPETFTTTLTAGTDYVIAVIDWTGTTVPTGIVQVAIRKN